VKAYPGMSAGEARANGIVVADSVPDCATIELDPEGEPVITVGDDRTINISLPTRWRWVTIKGIIDL
jgi:hypothetical protein